MSGGENWQPGDLALCIKQGPWQTVRRGKLQSFKPLAGRIYTTTAVVSDEDGEFLRFANDGHGLFRSCRFVKITPEEPDEFDREVIDLLNTVSAGVIPSPAQGARIPTLPERALNLGAAAGTAYHNRSPHSFPHSRKNTRDGIADAHLFAGSLRDDLHVQKVTHVG